MGGSYAMKIYIDQGHNPINPDAGAEAFELREQDLTYEIGKQLAGILEANGFETRLSRPSVDTQLGSSKSSSTTRRIDDANEWEADYFISLHTNISSDPFATGSDAHIYRMTSDSKPLAESILNRLHLTTKLQNRGISAHSDNYLLRKTNMPAIVINMGFITNMGDAEFMSEHPEQFAMGIANGIMAYTQESTFSNNENDITPVAFYQLYPGNNTKTCKLIVEVYTEKNRKVPISNAEVSVYYGTCGKHIVVCRGMTDMSGHTMPIELPEYDSPIIDASNSKVYMYCTCVRHPNYFPKNEWFEIRDEKSLSQSISLVERKLQQ